jgi:HD-like signal output (HDOD) protein
MTNIDDIINGIDTLKPIPPVAAQIMALAEDENSSMSEIADLIVYDPSITASLLKICNSAYFGLSRNSGIMPYYRPMWPELWLKTMDWPIKST